MSKMRVLVVDDHTLLREAITALLSTHEEFEVVGEAGEGKEAVERANQLRPDLVLMDIVRPRMNGIEAARHIMKETPPTKVFVLTSMTTWSMSRWLSKQGPSAICLRRQPLRSWSQQCKLCSGGIIFSIPQ